MTDEQYRCLVAHMKHWQLGIEWAMADAKIKLDKEEVIYQLWKAGWDYDETTDTITYLE